MEPKSAKTTGHLHSSPATRPAPETAETVTSAPFPQRPAARKRKARRRARFLSAEAGGIAKIKRTFAPTARQTALSQINDIQLKFEKTMVRAMGLEPMTY